jgi:hypothetical protein
MVRRSCLRRSGHGVIQIAAKDWAAVTATLDPSLLRQPCLAEAIDRGPQNWLSLANPRDGEFWVQAESFSQSFLGFFYVTLNRPGGCQIKIGENDAVPSVECLATLLDRGVQMSKAEFSVGQEVSPSA